MTEILKQTSRNEIVVGWYHSHPGFGCWLSPTDINTQKTFEQIIPRTIAVEVEPIQSVRGKVVIDAFKTYGKGIDLGLLKDIKNKLKIFIFSNGKRLTMGLEKGYVLTKI